MRNSVRRPQTSQSSPRKSTVNEVAGKNLPLAQPNKCVRTENIGPKYISYLMCIKPIHLDMFISGAFDKNGIWEKDMVENVLLLTANYPNGTFLDIGANIGTFSVAVAAAKYRVVAVDPLISNLAYIKTSTTLNGVVENVRYFLNAVSDEKTMMYAWNRYPDNEGAMAFLSKEEAAKKPNDTIVDKVESATLKEILANIDCETIIIKIDVEGFECKALGQFLKDPNEVHFVPYILMEWELLKNNFNGNCPDVKDLLESFKTSGYSPHHPHDLMPIRVEDHLAWMDVLWVHRTAFKISPK